MLTFRRPLWQQQHVVDVGNAAFAARTYIEHADLRAIMRELVGGQRLETACEIGAGFGRMVVVLSEFADRVTAMEREAHFVTEAARLLPAITFVQVDSLTRLQVPADSFEFVMTFTVLQHLPDSDVEAAAREIVRILKPGGHALICEETDPLLRASDHEGRTTTGRPVPAYERLFTGLELIETKPRRVEPTYPRADVGTYMLFRQP